MRRHDEHWSVPLIAARALSFEHIAGALARERRPRGARLAAVKTRLHLDVRRGLRARLRPRTVPLAPAPPALPRVDEAR